MAAGGGGDRSVEQTPTWAVAGVCAVFVIISIMMEHGIHSLGKWFHKRHKKEMAAALEKIKAELMLMGFISLLLTVGTPYVAKICIPEKVGNTMLPCTEKDDKKEDDDEKGEHDRRRLLWFAGDASWRRHLAAAASDSESCAEGKVALISQSALHQLHIFIFVLAFFHILYSVITMLLAKAKMKKWKSWESETTSLEYEYTHDPARFRLAHQTSFVRRHSGLSTTPGIRWVVAFFRQFLGSVSKVDYLTMRHGFINAHFAPNSKFDFHKYIKRSMEDDFKRVVGISFPLWIFAALYLLVNKDEWHTLAWLSFVPFIILVIVGSKLELIIMEMAQEIEERSAVVLGAPVVEPSNKFFWFNRPQWVLFLIHLTLFQNAFQLAFFLWAWYEYGLGSCFHDHENTLAMSVRVCLGLGLQILCSYITFPLYALVTQMGSHMKKGIFEEQTTRALKNWHKAARARNKMRSKVDQKGGGGGDASPSIASGYTSGDVTPIQSPMHLLHKYKHKQSSSQPEVLDHNIINASSPCSLSDAEFSEHEPSTTPPPLHNNHSLLSHSHNINFSFSNPNSHT